MGSQRGARQLLSPGYNPRMRMLLGCSAVILMALFGYAQWPGEAASISVLSIPVKDLPKVSLWTPYSFQLGASGGIEPYEWRLISSSLPEGFSLSNAGELTGLTEEGVRGDFMVLVSDSSRPPKQARKNFTLSTEIPLVADWNARPEVNGLRIDGSFKISNQTGRDFDLTVIILAVKDTGRATALGYQHFTLNKDTRELEIPFGEALPPANYAVSVDVVGEERCHSGFFGRDWWGENSRLFKDHKSEAAPFARGR